MPTHEQLFRLNNELEVDYRNGSVLFFDATSYTPRFTFVLDDDDMRDLCRWYEAVTTRNVEPRPQHRQQAQEVG